MTSYGRSDEDYQPLGWIKGYPIHATHFIIILHVTVLVVFSLLAALLNRPGLALPLMFSTEDVLGRLELWQPFTYAFINPLSWNFLFSMLMLFWCGWELERFLGRKVFLLLYTALLLIAPLVLLAIRLVTGLPGSAAGSVDLHFGIFIAFATVYPNAEFFFGLLAKWIAWVLIVFLSLGALNIFRADPSELPVLWGSVLGGYFGVRYFGASGGFPFWDRLKERFAQRSRRSKAATRYQPRRLVESKAPAAAGKASGGRSPNGGEGELHDSIDPLLDKIRLHGLASLTHSERATLERARISLLRKERER